MNAVPNLHPLAIPPATPILDPARCDGCGKCAEACPVSAIRFDRNHAGRVLPTVDAIACTYCTACEAACPTAALTCPYEILAPSRAES